MEYSEEEKKAIEEEIQSFIQKYESYVFYSRQHGDTIENNPYIRKFENYKTILNLIEKQQKEIERLGKDNKKLDVENQKLFEDIIENYISKGAIRESINNITKNVIENQENNLDKDVYAAKMIVSALKELLGE